MAAMSSYQPSSRRPIAAVFRRTGDVATRFCVRHGIHPDAISYLSIVAALIAAIGFSKSSASRSLLFIAPLFATCGSGSTCSTEWSRSRPAKPSRRGEILNDLPDRISDVVIFVGVAHSGL